MALHTPAKKTLNGSGDDLTARTISDFGEQWVNYQDNPGYYGDVSFLADIFGPLMSINDVNGCRCADIGSGTGRIVNMLLDAGAAHVIAVEPSRAYEVLRENTANRADNVTYLNIRGDELPPKQNLDLIVSMGVLHHIPDPDSVVAASFSALRSGGRMLVWLYGREGNESYLRLFQPLHLVTKQLPHLLLAGLCQVLNLGLDIYICLCRYFPLPMKKYMSSVLARLPRSVRYIVIYDQLNPAYAKYYCKAEAEELLRRAGFVDVHAYHRHGYSWTVVGTRQ